MSPGGVARARRVKLLDGRQMRKRDRHRGPVGFPPFSCPAQYSSNVSDPFDRIGVPSGRVPARKRTVAKISRSFLS